MKKEERNKKKRRKIFLSLLLILFVGVILTASTYTWFTANRQVTVENLDVNVSTSAGLQISVDAMDWKTVVTKEDIIDRKDGMKREVVVKPIVKVKEEPHIEEVEKEAVAQIAVSKSLNKD